MAKDRLQERELNVTEHAFLVRVLRECRSNSKDEDEAQKLADILEDATVIRLSRVVTR